MKPFDAPGLSAPQFLYAVMCDSTVPIMLRIKAADLLLRIDYNPTVRAIKVMIEGGYPDPVPMNEEYVTPTNETLTPSQRSCAQRLRAIHIATLDGMPVKGNA
jgi:hypothetical protein